MFYLKKYFRLEIIIGSTFNLSHLLSEVSSCVFRCLCLLWYVMLLGQNVILKPVVCVGEWIRFPVDLSEFALWLPNCP